jgi:integrase
MAEGYSRRLKGAFGRRSLKSVTTSELVDNLVAYAKDSPVAANRCLSYWKLVFQYANQRGWAASSPLASTTSKAIGGPEKSRDRVLTNAEIQWVFQWDHRHAKLLRFLLLTGLRISEAQAATAEQIEGDILNIPDNKSSRPHFVFLTPLAKDQIDTTDPTGRLFPPCSSTSVQSALRATGATFTPHDLRRTFATRAAGLTQPHIVEKLLNHSLPGVMAVYNRNDYREERITATISVSDLIQGLLESKV